MIKKRTDLVRAWLVKAQRDLYGSSSNLARESPGATTVVAGDVVGFLSRAIRTVRGE